MSTYERAFWKELEYLGQSKYLRLRALSTVCFVVEFGMALLDATVEIAFRELFPLLFARH